MDAPHGLVVGLQYLFLALLLFYQDLPSNLINGQQCFILVPVPFLQGHGEHVDGIPCYVLAFVLDVLVNLAFAVLAVVGSSSASLLETQHKM